MVVRNRAPEPWFGAEAELYAEKRGAGVDELIRRIDQAAHEYPYAKTLHRLAGTELQHLYRLDRARGPRARGRPAGDRDRQGLPRHRHDLHRAERQAASSSRCAACFGVTASGVDGFELNILSLNFGVSASGIKLPIVGRIGSPRIDGSLPRRTARQP